MLSIKNFILRSLVVSLLGFTSAAQASYLPPSQHLMVQVGGFIAHQGESQNIGIDTLIGDHFSVSDANDQNYLLGLGYYFDAFCASRYSLMLGVSAYYLAPTNVKGYITQEQLFQNLSYHYSVTNIPVYIAAKALIPMDSFYSFTINGGLGVNIIQTGNYTEESLDGGVTIPGNTFSSEEKTVFSGMIGFGIQFNHLLGCYPLELSYQFFYLGNGNLKKGNQVLNNLDTGNSYANALMLTASFA